jgi:hypothetical protein
MSSETSSFNGGVLRDAYSAEEFFLGSLGIDGIPLTEVEKNWRRIESFDELAIDPICHSKIIEAILCEPLSEIEI